MPGAMHSARYRRVRPLLGSKRERDREKKRESERPGVRGRGIVGHDLGGGGGRWR